MLAASTCMKCPACQAAALTRSRSGSTCEACGWGAQAEHGVVDYFAPGAFGTAPSPDHTPTWRRALIQQLSLPDDEDTRAALDSVFAEPKRLGSRFLDAEEDIFLERFCIENHDVDLRVEWIAGPAEAKAGKPFHVSVRAANAGAFDVLTSPDKPLVLGYRWARSGATLAGEHPRTALPVRLRPGMAATVPMEVVAPKGEGPHELVVIPLIEGERWLDDGGRAVSIMVGRRGPPVLRDLSGGREFSAPLEDELSAAFIDRWCRDLPDDALACEIASGIWPTFLRSQTAQTRRGVLIANDVSMRLLKVAALIHRRREYGIQPEFGRFDATASPFHDGVLDVATIARAWHHFPEPMALVREIRRVLKPGGLFFALCEPVAHVYDAPTLKLIEAGVNEQVFPPGAYERMAAEAGLELVDAQVDWGFSFKGVFRKV